MGSISAFTVLFSLFSSSTFADEAKGGGKDEVSGLVKVVGSAYNARVVLTDSTGQNQQALCRDDSGKRIGRLSGMTVKAKGAWDAKDPKDRCFAVSSFEIEKATSGRKPLVGILNRKDADFVLETSDGQQHALDRVSTGLKGMVGKKVIVDVKPLKGANGGESWKVVSYSEYP
jgi:hypothetical protein